jgi:hypothetical protein
VFAQFPAHCVSRVANPPYRLRQALLRDAASDTQLNNRLDMIVGWKRLALDPADHCLLDRKNKEVLYSRIAKYVAVRRNRGEQMKAIVPAAAKHYRVKQRTVWAAVRNARTSINRPVSAEPA